MKKSFSEIIMVMLAAIALSLAGCGDSDETKGERLLGQAEVLMQQNNELQAEQVLNDLIAKYPETKSAEVANKHLKRIQQQRELRENAGLVKIIDSYQKVFDGYYALYAEYPRSVAALDQSDYFFDSAYLREITPEGYKTYLKLKSDGSDYRVWCVALEQGRGIAVEAQDRKLIPFEYAETLEKIKADFQAVAWDDKLVALQEQNQQAACRTINKLAANLSDWSISQLLFDQ